jgi:hypothetical protein
MRQRRLECLPELEDELFREDLFVDFTIYDVPLSLLKTFSHKMIQLHYPGGVSEAIKDLMRKAIMEQEIATT